MNNKSGYILGVDEVGRGAVAGPIIGVSYSLPIDTLINLHYLLTQPSHKSTVGKKHHKKPLSIKDIKKLQRLQNLVSHDLKQYKTQFKIKKELKYKDVVYFPTKVNQLINLQDSKKMTAKQRAETANLLLKIGKWGIGLISNKEIDKNGIQKANLRCMHKSLKAHSINKKINSLILVDHFEINLKEAYTQNNTCMSITKGDSKSFIIAAASILAKEYRDYLMGEWHKKFKEYGFNKHVGYGTKSHLEAIKKHGPCEIHRLSYKVFKEFLKP